MWTLLPTPHFGSSSIKISNTSHPPSTNPSEIQRDPQNLFSFIYTPHKIGENGSSPRGFFDIFPIKDNHLFDNIEKMWFSDWGKWMLTSSVMLISIFWILALLWQNNANPLFSTFVLNLSIYGSSGRGQGKSWRNVTFWLKVWGCYGQRKAYTFKSYYLILAVAV